MNEENVNIEETVVATETSIEEPAEVVKELTNAEKLVASAKKLSWPLGTSKSKWVYETGKPTDVCKAAMKKRGYESKVSLSDCGHFMNTVIQDAFGKKTTVLSQINEPFPKTAGMKVIYSGKSVKLKQLKPGDILRYRNADRPTQHTLIYLGKSKTGTPIVSEGGREARFGVIRKTKKFLGTKKKIEILRAIED